MGYFDDADATISKLQTDLAADKAAITKLQANLAIDEAKIVALQAKVNNDATVLGAVATKLAAVEKQTMLNTHAIAALPNNSTGAIIPPPPSARTMRRNHIRTRIIQRWAAGPDDTWANDHFDDIDGGNLTSHPTAITVQIYALLQRVEIDTGAVFNGTSWTPGGDDGASSAACNVFADNYAAAHGYDPEDNWIHAKAGTQNYVMNILSIAADGTLKLKDLTHGGRLSYPYKVGWTITVSGTTAGAGDYVISALTVDGFKLTGWTAGALGTAGKIFRLGDGTVDPANRSHNFYWSEWRNVPNFSNANCRAMHQARAVKMMTVGNRNAILFDELDSSTTSQIGLPNSLEYSTGGNTAFNADLCTCIAGMLTIPGGPKYIRSNVANYHFAGDIAVARASRGLHNETSLSLIAYDFNWISQTVSYVAEGIDIEFSNGGLYNITPGTTVFGPGVVFTGLPGGYTAGNYPRPTERGVMSLIAQYYIAVDPTQTLPDGTKIKHCIIDLTNGYNVNQGPLSALWPAALDVDIGQPTGPYTRVSATDPAGFAVWQCMRKFSLDGGTTLSAVVTWNNNVNGQNNYGENSLTTQILPAPPSGKTWHMLNADGTYGATALTSINSRRSEGIIVVAI